MAVFFSMHLKYSAHNNKMNNIFPFSLLYFPSCRKNCVMRHRIICIGSIIFNQTNYHKILYKRIPFDVTVICDSHVVSIGFRNFQTN